MKDIQQLIKKSNEVGRYDNVFPKTFIDAIKDRETGVSLRDILSSFNMYFLTYMGSPEDTRLQLPKSLRRMGVWITYVTWDNTVHIEWYSSDDISDEIFRSSLYWKEGTNSLVGDLSISAEGNWVINGEDTDIPARGEQGITPILRVSEDNRLEVSYNEGNTWNSFRDIPVFVRYRVHNNKLQESIDFEKTWEDVSDYIGAWFRWNKISEIDGTLQISRDEKKTWEDISPIITTDIITNSEDIIKNDSKELEFANKEYSPEQFSGLGRVYLRKNTVDGKNILTQEMINKTNTRYIIQYDYDLDDKELTISDNCIFEFSGGSLSNGTIQLNKVAIEASNCTIFNNTKLIGSIANNKFKTEWIGIYPNDENIDTSSIIQENLYELNAILEFNIGEYYLSELYIEKQTFQIQGKGNALDGRTIFKPKESGQRYLIKFGGGKDIFGDNKNKCRKAYLKGITVMGDPNKRMVNITDGNYKCGMICVDRVEIGNFSFSFVSIYDIPSLYIGYVYECTFDYVSTYNNFVKSDCPVIYIDSGGIDRHISASTINLLMTEVICGPIIKVSEYGNIDELVINNLFHEGTQEWNPFLETKRHYIGSDTELYTKATEYEKDTRVPLIDIHSNQCCFMTINNIFINNINYQWVNTLDKIKSSISNSIINTNNASNIKLSLGVIKGYFIPYFYIEYNSEKLISYNSIFIEEINTTSGTYGAKRNTLYKVHSESTYPSTKVSVIKNECLQYPYKYYEEITPTNYISSQTKQGLTHLPINAQAGKSSSIKNLGNTEVIYITPSSNYIVDTPIYLLNDSIIEIFWIFKNFNNVLNINIEYYSTIDNSLVETTIITLNKTNDAEVLKFRVKYKENTYIKIGKQEKGYSAFLFKVNIKPIKIGDIFYDGGVLKIKDNTGLYPIKDVIQNGIYFVKNDLSLISEDKLNIDKMNILGVAIKEDNVLLAISKINIKARYGEYILQKNVNTLIDNPKDDFNGIYNTANILLEKNYKVDLETGELQQDVFDKISRTNFYYIPSAGELSVILKKRNLINTALSKIGGELIGESYIGTSTQCDKDLFWSLYSVDSDVNKSSKSSITNFIPFIKL